MNETDILGEKEPRGAPNRSPTYAKYFGRSNRLAVGDSWSAVKLILLIGTKHHLISVMNRHSQTE